jgi:hypothetical protein
MITIREIERDERHAGYVIKKFIERHTFFSLVVATIGILFATASFTMIMLLAAVGGSQLENALKSQLCSGQITIVTYNMILGTMITIYNFYSILINFIISAVIVIWLYIIFKEYLKYKRDNL